MNIQSDLAFKVVTGFDFFFDIPEILQINVENEFNLPPHSWNLFGHWSPAMIGYPKAKVLGLVGNADNVLYMLLDDGSVYYIDTRQKTSSLPTIEFFLNRWILWLALFVMVIFFSIYEMTPTNPRSTIALSSLLYVTVLILTIATVFIEI